MKNIAIIGAGGHAKVIIDIINELNIYNIIGIFDDNKTGSFSNIPILGKSNEINDVNKKNSIDSYIIGIGNDKVRKDIYEKYNDLKWDILIHPSAIISKTAKLDLGTVVCAGAIIQTEVQI